MEYGHNDSALHKKRGDIKLPFSKIEELVTKKLDPFETKRLVDKLQISKDAQFSYDDAIEAFKE